MVGTTPLRVTSISEREFKELSFAPCPNKWRVSHLASVAGPARLRYLFELFEAAQILL